MTHSLQFAKKFEGAYLKMTSLIAQSCLSCNEVGVFDDVIV